jgi:hypothetical protein
MKKMSFLFLLLSLLLLSQSAWARCGMMMGDMGSGMRGMEPGMMGHGMGMGMGMDSGRMGPAMRSCMMQECWQHGMGGVMPHATVQNVFREISGYQLHADDLGLSEEQLQRLNEIKENLTVSAIRTHADLQISAINFRRTMTRESPDIAAAEKIIDRNTEMWSKLQKAALTATAEARGVLTTQQRRQAGKMARSRPMMEMDTEQEQPGMEQPNHEQHHP